jgi:hypothetical protein
VIFVAPLLVHLGEPAVDAGKIALPARLSADLRQKLVAIGLGWKRLDHGFGNRPGLTPLPLRDQGRAQGDLRLHAVRHELQDPAENLDPPFPVPLAVELRSDFLVLGQRLLRATLLPQQLGHLEPVGGVRGIQGRHLPQQVERLVLVALAVVGVGGGLKRLHGVRPESQALIELGERKVDVVPLGIDLADLLVESDRLGIEAVAHEALGDLQVGRNGLVGLALLELEITQLEADVGVLGIRLEKGLVVLRCLVQSALLQMLLGGLEDLPLVDRQGPLGLELRARRGVLALPDISVSADPRGS